MRRGGLKNEFIVRDGKVLFSQPITQDCVQIKIVNMYQYTHLRKFIIVVTMIMLNYPNEAFRLRNETKRLAAIQHKVPKDIQEANTCGYRKN